MKFYSLVVVLFVLLMSCSKKQAYFTENETIVKTFIRSVDLKGDLFIEDDSACIEIFNVDSFLVLGSAINTHFFYVFNNADGNFLGSFGTKGQGPNELVSCICCGQLYNAPDTVAIWVNDVNGQKMYLVDINKSLQRRAFSFIKEINVLPLSVNAYIMDGYFLSEGMRNTNYYWNRMNLLTGEEEKPEPVYARNINETFSIYKSIWRMKPDRTYMAGAMRSVNQINLFDLISVLKIY